MEKEDFIKLLKERVSVQIKDVYIFDDLEVFDSNTDRSILFDSMEELLESKIADDKIIDLVGEIKSFELVYDGGRGSSSSNVMGGGFSHARSGRGEKGFGQKKFPASFNIGTASASVEKTIKRFTEKYGKADVEYGISVDNQGFVHAHVKGSRSSVAIGTMGKDHMIVHNHPSGGNFSDTDLITTSNDRNARGVVATSSKATYTFTKTNKFKAKGFIKAVKKAQWPSKYDYDKGSDWWLKKNATAFGYKYKKS